MSDIKCSGFEPRSLNPETKIATWVGDLTPAPSQEWQKVFFDEMAAELAIGNYSGDKPHINGSLESALIQFDSHDSGAKAAADLIRRVVQKTNGRMAKLEAEWKKQSDAEKRKLEENQAELKRIQEKYQGGI